jgi:S-adenosylmethionine:tRNA ribosyltransferase-isomerase
MLVSDFNFDLPEELIAQHPPAVRGSSRMLVVDSATCRGICGAAICWC